MLVILNLVAAFNGALVGAVLLAQERFGPVRTRVSLACFLLLMSGLLALFVMLDTGRVAYSPPLGLAMDVAALLTGAFLLDYVAHAVSRGLGYWPYAPPALYLAVALGLGGPLSAPTDFRLIIALQIAFSGAAGLTYLRARADLPANWVRRSEHLHLPLLLLGIALLHAAQLLRLLAPDNTLFFDLVPLVGALGLLAFTVYAMLGSQTLRSIAAPRGPAPADAEFGSSLDAAMADTRAFLDPDLSLPKVAAMLNVAPPRLSAYLNAQRGMNFRAFVNSLRIDEAKRLLRAPQEARTSVEAVAKLAGFRSRSSFYTAFAAQAGVSPQDYRTGAEPR